MRKRFKRLVWKIYKAEYKFLNSDREPSKQISFCKMSWNLLALSVTAAAILGIFILFVVFLEMIGLIIAPLGWFLGFSPEWRKWMVPNWIDESRYDLWHEKTGVRGYGASYYKINSRWAPWEIVLFPLTIPCWILKHTPFKPLVPLGNIIIRRIFGARCPFPLDFSVVAGPDHSSSNPT